MIRIVFLFALIATRLPAQQRMVDEIRNWNGTTGLWWAGHNSWIIKSGDLVVATDLILSEEMRIAPSPITPEELAPLLDISFVTHAHDDHFNEYTTRILIQKSKCIFVLPESC